MNRDEMLNENNISGKVEELMYDITEEAAARRRKDADMLDAIRSRQHGGSSGGKTGGGLMSGIKNKLKKDNRKKSIGAARYMPTRENVYNDNGFRYDGETEVIGYDETEVMGAEDETEVMDDDLTEIMEQYAPLSAVYLSGDMVRRTALVEGTYRIGSKAAISDIILNSCHVSRRHAEFIRRGEKLFVVDKGSTNGTYINGSSERLKEGIEYEIEAGDVITFADVEVAIEEQ